MNLGIVLDKAWQEASKAHQSGLALNQSVVAYGLSQVIKSECPNLDVTVDCRAFEGYTRIPTLVILTRDVEPRVMFVGKLLLGNSISPERAIADLPCIEDKDFVNVLGRDAASGEYIESPMALSKDFSIGLFWLPNGQAHPHYKSLANLLTKDQLTRFFFAYNAPSSHQDRKREFFFVSPAGHVALPEEKKYPEMRIRLDFGREDRLDALIWEPSYDETIKLRTQGIGRYQVVKRMRKKAEEFFFNRKYHYRDIEVIDAKPPRIKNTCIHAWLSSTPMSKGALYSELIVIFSIEYQPNMTLEQVLWEGLHDLDWEAHAEDVDEKSVLLWKEAWKTKTVH